ncbi:sodium-dependent bicarbonate transport family permease [Aquabacterium sp.]|uniref:sodium-dependent bicarbonate transport family permease n=1 Tax=Aquabacterium sp. TaxID=1872578 RepID=UPI0024895239|nr:sodium-dependent bicarbonate transport family permease [Aquabacterium sp.]MDI1259979.1 sodium-dependent bicarbonate transport family permease [Aquabacterium sp.]
MQNFLDPAILFFVFGITAGLLRSNLELPAAISRFLSLYLLMALGLKGGFALSKSGFTEEVVASLACAVAMAAFVPWVAHALLRRLVPPFDAVGISATYGSVSAVTFITAVQFLESQGTPAGGHMAAAMALMESPAIILAVVMANLLRRQAASMVVQRPAVTAVLGSGGGGGAPMPLGKVLHEAFTDGAQLLLLGAMVIGMVSGTHGEAVMKPFVGDLFKGLLAFFLLDMGLLTARHLAGLKALSPWLLVYAVVAPLVHATAALGLAAMAGLDVANATLIAVLSASASYIAVPAVLRHAVPEAQPALYMGMSLGLTFPFNILVGIPLYASMAKAWLG